MTSIEYVPELYKKYVGSKANSVSDQLWVNKKFMLNDSI